jgi:dolichyl-phosphate-mannose--protein O-mannosyl transferase
VLPSLIVALLYFPWFAASRTSFLYYMTPVAPFLAILVATALARLAGQPPDLHETTAPTTAPTPDVRRRAARAGGGSAATRPLVLGLAAFLGAAAATALFWWPIGQAVAFVFYELPARVAPVVGIAVASVTGAVVLVASIFICTRPRFLPLWRFVAWGFAGVTLGMAIVFAPIVLDLPVTPDEFYRLMWLPSWI